ncbi:MAG: hypothetical protein ABL936_00795 [Aestuariivirga sp.]
MGIMRNLRVIAFVVGLGTCAQVSWAADVASDDSLGLILSGEIDSWNGYAFYGNESGDTEYTEDAGQLVSSISGRLSIPLGTSFAVQADGQVAYSSNALFGSEQDDLFQSSYLLGGHMSWRNPSAGLLGGFTAFGGGDHDDDVTPYADFFALGGEGQFYLDDMTVYIQAGYLDSDNDSDFIRNAGFVRGVLRWFFTPDNRLQTELTYVDGTSDSGGDEADTTVLEWSVRYDTVLPNLPILGDTNVFIGYRGTDFDKNGSDPGGFTDHTVLLGFAHSFGANSVQEMDRSGATLDLPNFGRWVAAGETLE